jgi:ATP-binding cassette, subfamily B, heavy metal transporter
MNLLRRLSLLIPQIKKILVGGACFALVIECLKILPPYLMKVAIDLLVGGTSHFSTVFWVISGVLIVCLCTTLVEDYFIRYTTHTTFFIEAEILKKAHQKLLSLDIAYHENHPSGELVHLMNTGSVRLRELMWFTQDQFLGAFIQIVLTAGLLLWMHFTAGILFLAFMPLTLYMVVRSGKRIQPFRKTYHNVLKKGTWKMNQSLFNIRTVKDFAQEQREFEDYRKILEEYQRLADIRIREENVDIRNRDMLIGFGRFAVLFYAAYLVTVGEMTAGTLVLFATLSEKVLASLYRLGRLYSMLGDSVEAVEQFAQIFDEVPRVEAGSLSLKDKNSSGEMRLRNVCFSYNGKGDAISKVNLVIPAKSVCAFVGPSGAGKSTLVKLLLRHYDVSSGSIELDGQNIKNINIEEYRKRIAVVSQDIEIFDSSVHANIAYGRAASRNEVEEAAINAYAHEFISSLPEGYDTRVGERGVKLSGGQKQRIGIARALLMRPALVIFDEATSSLDSHSELMIQEALKRISHRQTMIIIAHRLSTIAQSDMIVVFDRGEVVEIGTHDELIKQKGSFQKMRHLQSLGELRA